MKTKQFNFQNKRAHHLLAIGMAYVLALSNSAAALFIPCILASFFTEIGYAFSQSGMGLITPSRNTLSNIIEESAVTSMIDLQRELGTGVKIFISSDHGNKKGLHHLVKVLSFWSKCDNDVKRVTLDTDASGGTSEETADAIHTSLTKLDLSTRRVLLAGQHGDAGGGGTGASLMEGLRLKNRINDIDEYLSSTCANHGLNLTLSVPTIKCFGTGGLEKRNILQFLHSIWNLTQQFEWDEFRLLWKSCTGELIKVRMPQPVLTRWEYVGLAIEWVIVRLDQIEKMAQAVINTNAAISSKNIIASAITSLSKEVIIRAHTYFLKSYHDSFFAIHFQWMKHVDTMTKKNRYLSRHMAVHVYVMHKLLKEIENEWKTMTVFSPFIQYCNENIQNEDEKNMTINVMPAKFFKLAKDVLIKHFDQWRSPMLLPLVLGGDAIPAQALSSYLCYLNPNPTIPQTYYSHTHHVHINVQSMMVFLTGRIKTPEDRRALYNREYYHLHQGAIEKLARGASIWLDNQQDNELNAFGMYMKIHFLPLPSNNQCVEAGVKDAALCRTSGRSERIASLLNFFRSTITTYVVNDARAVAITDPQKERGVKRKANDNENRHKIWISESSKVHSILKQANKFNPEIYSLEQKRIMTLKVGTMEHYSTERINKSDLKFRQKMNKQKIQNTAQQKVGVDTTPYLLGKIQYGKLRSLHINLMREEILHRTNIPIDNSLGIRALAALLRTHENERVGNEVKFFMPQLKSSDEWDVG